MRNLAGEAEEGSLKLDFYGQLGPEFRGAKAAESPVHGCQAESAHNGHFCSRCYYPLFIFNRFGDCERTRLGRATPTPQAAGADKKRGQGHKPLPQDGLPYGGGGRSRGALRRGPARIRSPAVAPARGSRNERASAYQTRLGRSSIFEHG